MVPPTSSTRRTRMVELIRRLSSVDTPFSAKLNDLRALKNQIIGNRMRKLGYMSIGAVQCVVSILSDVVAPMHGGDRDVELNDLIAFQAVLTIGSFACGLELGVKAVLESGVFPVLISLVAHGNEKIVDAVARSLKFICQSKLAPKFDFVEEGNMGFLLSLLNSKKENLIVLGADIITHSCQTSMEQQILSDTGVITKLVSLLEGSLSVREASLESLSAVIKENPNTVANFLGSQNGRAVNFLYRFIRDKYPRTRLLACNCLVNIRNTRKSYLHDARIKTVLVQTLLELLEDPGRVGDDAPFVLSSLIAEKEDMQMAAFEANVIDKLCNLLETGPIRPNRLQGIFLALGDMCSDLECCRKRTFSLKALNYIRKSLEHDSADIRLAAFTLLRNLSRSIQTEGNCVGPYSSNTIYERLEALFAIRKLDAAEEAVSTIVESLAAKSPILRHGVAYVLSQLENEKAAAALSNVLPDPCERPLVRQEAAKALGSIVDDHCVVLLKEFANDPEPIVSQSCEVTLKRLDCMRLGKFYELAFYPEYPQGSCKLPVSAEEEKSLCDLLLDKKQPIWMRFRALSRHTLGGPAPHNAFVNAMRDASALLSSEAAFMLGLMRDYVSIPALKAVLNDLSLHPIVRHKATEALGAFGLESNVPALKRSLDSDPAPEARETCYVALSRIEALKNLTPLLAPLALCYSLALPYDCSSIPILREVLLDENRRLYECLYALCQVRMLCTC